MHFKILKGIQFQLSNFDFLFNYHQMISIFFLLYEFLDKKIELVG